MKKLRCAIYSRKSSEDGLEQEFNSLHAQREACEAYVLSQRHEGWVCLANPYDDGGLSGGTLERPALKRLLDDIRAGQVDQVVVYKIDRLTRSLADFSKIVDTLDDARASFVSVAQSFNTATSMGRLTLNMLLSFAQFEREVTAERIRDKITASKRKGLWMGGNVSIGYKPNGRTIEIFEPEAQIVRTLYDLYDQHRKIRLVKDQADKMELRTALRRRSNGEEKGGQPFSFGHIHHILTNPIYAGRMRHKTKVYDGQHPALIDPDLWDAIQQSLQESAATQRQRRLRSRGGRRTQSSPLTGKLFDETGDRLSPSHSKSKKGTRLRYYISHRLMRKTRKECPDAWRLPALPLEQAVADCIARHLTTPTVQTSILINATLAETAELIAAAKRLTNWEASDLIAFVSKAHVRPGQLTIELDADTLAEALGLHPKKINLDLMNFDAPFQLRRRGVETKIIVGGEAVRKDETLMRSIAVGHKYLDLIKAGKSYIQVAKQEGTTKRMVQFLVEFAFLAPDIVEAVFAGTQPTGLTTQWVKTNKLPKSWDAQREMIAAL